MNNYRIVKGDMFEDIPKGVYLLHSCNAIGAWGAGIAAEFKKRYPESFAQYKKECLLIKGYENFVGCAMITHNDNQNIINLITSYSYGVNRCSEEKILDRTYRALDDLRRILPEGSIIYSPKINSGLFGIPWKRTLCCIEYLLTHRKDVTWTVFEY